MSDDLKQAVKEQFRASAAGYVNSTVHAKGADLPRLVELAGLTGEELILDVATAVGHTAMALAPGARHVTGIDLTAEMLDEARTLAAKRGITNLTFAEGDAEKIPFPDDRFDVVTCRIAAHHFPEIRRFCQEAYRVLRPGGKLLVVDNVAPEDDGQDRFINRLDKLRDPSHFRAWRVSEWQEFLTDAGFSVSLDRLFTTTMEWGDWLERMNVPEPVRAEIREHVASAPAEIRQVFAICAESFQLYKAILVAVKPGAGTAEEKSRAQYGRQAAGYTISQGHAGGSDLAMLVEGLGLTGSERVLDVATGTGHTALAAAKHAAHVTGLDLTPEMLAEARRLAADRGLEPKVDWVEGDAHALPFTDHQFDVVTVRRAPHHFADARRALAEMGRVVKPGGLLGFVDQVSPEESAGYTLIEAMEKLRDPSHVRAYPPSQWMEIFEQTGWEVLSAQVQSDERSFEDWLDLAGCTEAVRTAILDLLDSASPEARSALNYRAEGGERHFRRDRLVAICRRRAE